MTPSGAIGSAFFWSFLLGVFEGEAKSLLATANSDGRSSISGIADMKVDVNATRQHIYTSLTALEDFPDDDDFHIDTLFGSASAISDDGQYVIIGAKGTDDACFDYICPGRVFVYRWTGGAWAEDAVLRPPSWQADDGEKQLEDQVRFGESVAINGKYALVGAPYHGGLNGRVYVFRNLSFSSSSSSSSTSSRWDHVTTIVGANDEFLGPSIGLDDNDVAIVGASEYDDKRGKAYIYSVASDPPERLAELAPDDRRRDDRFGDAVDVRGEYAIVGSPRHDVDGRRNMGAAYVFRKTATSAAGWMQVEKLVPFGGLGDQDDNFGFSVAIRDGLAVVGAPADSATDETNFGSAYVFRKVNDPETGLERWISDAHLYDREEAKRGDLFGKAVAVYGNRIFIGAPGRDYSNDVENSGTGYFFGEVGCLWVVEDVVEPEDLKGYRAIGTSVGLGAAGFVVGGIDGLAYVGRFEEQPEEPEDDDDDDDDDDDNNPEAEDHIYDLIALEDFPYDDDYYLETYFGYAVDMSSDGNYVIVGAKGVDEDCFPIEYCPGRVFVYEWNVQSEEWLQSAILTPEKAMDENEFGAAVAIDGQFALVGAPYHKDMNGSVYVFRLTSDGAGSTWKFHYKIAGSRRGFFGASMALDDDIAIIGASEHDERRGRAYVYDIASKPAIRLAQLVPSDGRENDRFGEAVDIHGDFAIVGSPFHDVDGLDNVGAAYVFRKTNNGWVQDQKVVPANGYGSAEDNFGSSVSIHGDLAVVGAPADAVGNLPNYGSVYVFRRNNDDWTFEAQLLDRDGGSRGDLFGKSVGVYENRVFVGAPGRDYYGDAFNSGKGYLFVEDGAEWIQEDFVEPNDLIERRAIGTSIAVGEFGFVIGGIDGIAYVGRFKEEVAEEKKAGLISSIVSSKNSVSFAINDVIHFNLRDRSSSRQP